MSDKIDTCQLCNKPLGQDSQDERYRVCHNCRRCADCGADTTAVESNYCLDNNIPIKHARCMKLGDVNTLQAQIDLANISRLLTDATARISEMSFDQKFTFLRMLQEKAATVSILLNRDKKTLNQQLNAEKETKAAKQASAKKEEVSVATKVERKHLTDAAKTINAFTKNGISYRDAAKLVYNTEINIKKRTEEQARMTVIEAMVSLGSPKEDAINIFDGRTPKTN